MGALQILMRSNPMCLVRVTACVPRSSSVHGQLSYLLMPPPAAQAHGGRPGSQGDAPLPPPLQPGLTTAQSLLFFEAAAHHWLAIPTIFMAIVPIVFLFCNSASPLVVSAEASNGGQAPRALLWHHAASTPCRTTDPHMSHVLHSCPPLKAPTCLHHSGGPHLGVCGRLRRMVSCCACAIAVAMQGCVRIKAVAQGTDTPCGSAPPPFGTARYLSNRLVMWQVHSGTEGGAQELWRGSQAWIWMGERAACRAAQPLKSLPERIMLGWTVVLQLLGLGLGLTLESGGWADRAWRVPGT